MRKRKWYLAMLGIALLALLAGVAYEASTHVVRGWLRGEAFYDGRPTSYWRARCDEWLERFDTPEDAIPWAQSYVGFTIRKPDFEDGKPTRTNVPMFNSSADKKLPRPQTASHPLLELIFGSKHDDYAPHVLWGLPEAMPVLKELEEEERFRCFARDALQRADIYLERRRTFATEGWEIIHEQRGFSTTKR